MAALALNTPAIKVTNGVTRALVRMPPAMEVGGNLIRKAAVFTSSNRRCEAASVVETLKAVANGVATVHPRGGGTNTSETGMETTAEPTGRVGRRRDTLGPINQRDSQESQPGEGSSENEGVRADDREERVKKKAKDRSDSRPPERATGLQSDVPQRTIHLEGLEIPVVPKVAHEAQCGEKSRQEPGGRDQRSGDVSMLSRGFIVASKTGSRLTGVVRTATVVGRAMWGGVTLTLGAPVEGFTMHHLGFGLISTRRDSTPRNFTITTGRTREAGGKKANRLRIACIDVWPKIHTWPFRVDVWPKIHTWPFHVDLRSNTTDGFTLIRWV
jgi:hypothetical protein